MGEIGKKREQTVNSYKVSGFYWNLFPSLQDTKQVSDHYFRDTHFVHILHTRAQKYFLKIVNQYLYRDIQFSIATLTRVQGPVVRE